MPPALIPRSFNLSISVGSRTLSTTLRHGKSNGCWNTIPMLFSGAVTARSPSLTIPKAGFANPAANRKRVDFPQPLGPMMLTNSFGATVKETLSSAFRGALPFGWKIMVTSSKISVSPEAA